jgi:hypothetical protein
MQTRSSLKTSKAAGRRGAVHGVDRSEVEAVCTERDLKRCDLRPRGGSRSRPSGDGHEEREQARRAPQCASRFDAERLTPWRADLATGSTRVVAGHGIVARGLRRLTACGRLIMCDLRGWGSSGSIDSVQEGA